MKIHKSGTLCVCVCTNASASRQYFGKVIHLLFIFIPFEFQFSVGQYVYKISHIHLYNYKNMLLNVKWMDGKMCRDREKRMEKKPTTFLLKSYDNVCTFLLQPFRIKLFNNLNLIQNLFS